jgi:methylated-DNA-protein-cysteine methyltransferase related protein
VESVKITTLGLPPASAKAHWAAASETCIASVETLRTCSAPQCRRRRPALSRSDAFVTSLTERLLTYALGRELEYYDQPVVRRIAREAGAQGTTLAALVQAIVASDAFRNRVRAADVRRVGGADDPLTPKALMPRAKVKLHELLPARRKTRRHHGPRNVEENPALQAIRDVVAALPRGRVSTYGDVARAAGLPGRARQAGYALKHTPDGVYLPWHRVVGAGGKIAFPPGTSAYREQTRRLKSDGVKVENGRVARSALLAGPRGD